MIQEPDGSPFQSSNEEAISSIRDAVSRIRFGEIGITLHEGRIVQLEITEKRRLGR